MGSKKSRIAHQNWNMVVEEIEAGLKRARGERQRRLLGQMLLAAKANKAEAVIRAGLLLCELTRKVPPGCYFMSDKSFKLPGESVSFKAATDSLHLIHPQIYR